MPNFVPLHAFIGYPSGPDIVQLPEEAYYLERSHSERAVKNRSGFSQEPIFNTVVNINVLSTQKAREVNIRRYILQNGSRIKVGLYDARDNVKMVAAKTSVIHRVCLTDNMGTCIGIAIGAYRQDQFGRFLPGSKAMVYHAFTDNVDIVKTVLQKIAELKQMQYSVKIAFLGGDAEDEDSAALALKLRSTVHNLNQYSPKNKPFVDLQFDLMCDKRTNEASPLFAVVLSDNSVFLGDELATIWPQPPET